MEFQLSTTTRSGRTSRRPARYQAPPIDSNGNGITLADPLLISTKTVISLSSPPVRPNSSVPINASPSRPSRPIRTYPPTLLQSSPAMNFGPNRSTRIEVTAHELVDPNRLKCTLCGYRAKYNYILKRHMLVHRERPYACSDCPRRFSEENELKVHVRMHKNRCSKCRRHCFGPTHLRQHEKSCTAIQYTCYMCTFNTPRQWHLRPHMLKHTGEQPFQCSKCPRRFKSNRNLRYHMNKHPKV